MSIRTFLFCDVCNPQAVRQLEQRRGLRRGNGGKRVTDGRAWYEGDVKNAISEDGWRSLDGERHACPRCVERMKGNHELRVVFSAVSA